LNGPGGQQFALSTVVVTVVVYGGIGLLLGGPVGLGVGAGVALLLYVWAVAAQVRREKVPADERPSR
jgi:hypothetical protein